MDKIKDSEKTGDIYQDDIDHILTALKESCSTLYSKIYDKFHLDHSLSNNSLQILKQICEKMTRLNGEEKGFEDIGNKIREKLIETLKSDEETLKIIYSR